MSAPHGAVEEHEMKIKMNGGEWTGLWSEFSRANQDLGKSILRAMRQALEQDGKCTLHYGAAGTITLEVV